MQRKKVKSLTQVKQLAEKLMNKEYIIKGEKYIPVKIGYSFGFDNAKIRFGMCSYGKNKRITLSKYICQENLHNWSVIEDCILHEIAHAICIHINGQAGANHGSEWKQIAQTIGSNGIACYSTKEVKVKTKYTYYCPKCNTSFPAQRRRKGRTSCAKCHPTGFSNNHLLELKVNY